MKSMHAVLSCCIKIFSPVAVSAALIITILVPVNVFALTQPNGTQIPSAQSCSGMQRTGLAFIFACSCLESGICNIGDWCASGTCPNGQNGTCETTLYHNPNDNTCIPSNLTGLDPQEAASTEPEILYPSVTLKFTLLSRGTAIFNNAFGWYNVTGSKPTADDLHIILECNAAPDTTVTVDIKNEPAWAGGAIGFFLITPESHSNPGSHCDSGDCCATLERYKAGAGYVYYSEKNFNPDSTVPNSVIHLLIYQSRITDSKFYFAWEDIKGGQDPDFTDMVTAVEGVGTTPDPDGSTWFPWFLLQKHKGGGCHSHAARGGISGGLILALTAVFITRRRKPRQ